ESRSASLPPARVTLSSEVRLASTRGAVKSRACATPGAAAGTRTAAVARIVLHPLRVIPPRCIVVLHREHERRHAADQGFDQHQLLVGVVDEGRLAESSALLALREYVERIVMVGRNHRLLARGIVVGGDLGDAVAGAEI